MFCNRKEYSVVDQLHFKTNQATNQPTNSIKNIRCVITLDENMKGEGLG